MGCIAFGLRVKSAEGELHSVAGAECTHEALDPVDDQASLSLPTNRPLFPATQRAVFRLDRGLPGIAGHRRAGKPPKGARKR